MKDLIERGNAALASLSDGHVHPQNIEQITNFVAEAIAAINLLGSDSDDGTVLVNKKPKERVAQVDTLAKTTKVVK